MDLVSEAWRMAGADLDVRVQAPARVVIGGTAIDCSAFLPDFGSVNGVAAFSVSMRPTLPAPMNTDPYRSLLNDTTYARFDRDLFICTLNDWNWFGKGEPPDWYTGAPWSL